MISIPKLGALLSLIYYDGNELQTATMEQVGSRYYIPPELEEGRADQDFAVSA